MLNNSRNELDLAREDIDMLTQEGAFGEESRELLFRRESMSTIDYLYEIISRWNERVGIAGIETKTNALKIFNLIVNSYVKQPRETIDLWTILFNGTPEDPYLESLSGYTNVGILNVNFNKKITALENNISLSTKKEIAQDLANLYSKEVELLNKMLTVLIISIQISKNKKYNFKSLNKQKLYRKLEILEETEHELANVVTGAINRGFRNADSHLTFPFYPSENSYLVKGKESFYISFSEMMKIHLKAASLIQAITFGGYLFTIGHEDNSKLKKLIAELSKN